MTLGTLKRGDHVTSPRGGMPTIVVSANGSALLTTDGIGYRGVWCPHEPGSDVGYYEWVGGKLAGMHGWYHDAADCRGITQTG